MKIAVINTFAPFIYGGAEFLADSLCQKLKEYGHQSLLVKVPLQWNPVEKILDHVLAARLLRVEYNVDRVIALKFPAYYVPHPNKVLWLLHQFRQAYDLWGTQYQGILSTPGGNRVRESIINSDNRFLTEAKKIYTTSDVVTQRLQRFNNMSSEVLHPPLMNTEKYHYAEPENYVFYPSRLSHGKRQWLVIEAFKHIKANIQLIIAGNPDKPEDLYNLKELVSRYNLENKVKIIGHFISEEEKVRLYSQCLACVYTPYDEDYGYVTLEAFQSKKPVITCNDSGGTLFLVKDQQTGLVTEPHPEALAAAIENLYNRKQDSIIMGQQGHDLLMKLNINWDNVIGKLLA